LAPDRAGAYTILQAKGPDPLGEEGVQCFILTGKRISCHGGRFVVDTGVVFAFLLGRRSAAAVN